MTAIPNRTEDATVAFLTEALRSGGVIGGDTRVAEIEHEQIGVGVGIVGQLARLNLRYAGEAPGAPGSVVLKIPSEFPENRAIGNYFHFYEREGRFYREIGEKLAMRTPRCYWNHIDPDAGEYGLLLEDLGSWTSISQVAGAGPDRAAQALDALAGLHAAWWDGAGLDALDWMPRMDEPLVLSAGEQFRQAWHNFVALFGEELPDGAVELGARIKDVWEDLAVASLEVAPTTICHGDYRIDNLLFDGADSDGVAVLDWQISYKGPAISDVAYLLCQSLSVETRQAHEEALVRGWYDRVAASLEGGSPAAIDGYPFEKAWSHYRRGVLGMTVYPVVAGGSMDPANERGRELVALMAERVFLSVIQLGSEEFLD